MRHASGAVKGSAECEQQYVEVKQRLVVRAIRRHAQAFDMESIAHTQCPVNSPKH
jgi:hypothetical protein